MSGATDVLKGHHALEVLESEGLPFQVVDDFQVKLGTVCFWPTTGVFVDRLRNIKGRGVLSLLRYLNEKGHIIVD